MALTSRMNSGTKDSASIHQEMLVLISILGCKEAGGEINYTLNMWVSNLGRFMAYTDMDMKRLSKIIPSSF